MKLLRSGVDQRNDDEPVTAKEGKHDVYHLEIALTAEQCSREDAIDP